MCGFRAAFWNTASTSPANPEIPEQQLHGARNHVAQATFHTLGIPILVRREFDTATLPTSRPVASLISTPSREALRQRESHSHRIATNPAPADADYTIVGEVQTAASTIRSPPPPVAYSPNPTPNVRRKASKVAPNRPTHPPIFPHPPNLLSARTQSPHRQKHLPKRPYDEGLSKAKTQAAA